MTSQVKQDLNISPEELSSLKARIQSSNLASKDIDTLLKILQIIVSLKNLLEKRTSKLSFWLRKIFGLKTEKDSQKDRKKNNSSNSPSLKGRHGRNGRDDYPGAEKTKVPHPTLSAGNECPDCRKGKLLDAEPAVDYDWQGNSPITIHIYLLQRLICKTCGATFTAPSPVAETAKTVDDSEDDKKVSRCNRNAFANSVVACLRFLFGVPHYRLAKIQGRLGMALPEGTQYKMLEQVYLAALPIYEHLLFLAAQGYLIHADDTAIKILDWLRGKGPPTKTTKEPRKTAQTTAIVSKSEEGRNITLYLTGSEQAGSNLSGILEKRLSERGVPIYMCDALAANNPGENYVVIQVYCLDHGRRQFYDIKSAYPDDCEYVLKKLKQVYKADAEAKKMNLSPEDRLVYHQERSAEVITELGQWMVAKKNSDEVEDNGELGGAINYWLKRWSELTEFLHTPGVPLSNCECEQAIKTIITHRKNSLFYKTINGAKIGDVIQSLIVTCQNSNINCFKYLAWLQENKPKVKANPQLFLPWNYKSEI